MPFREDGARHPPIAGLATLIAALCAILAAAPSLGAGRAIAGFRPGDLAAQHERERRMSALIAPDTLRRHLFALTSEPHLAGTPGDYRSALYMRDQLAAWGWETRIEEIPVWLNYPVEASLALVSPRFEPLAVRERGADPARAAGVPGAFHGYGAEGDVTAPVVYANYGDVGDFAVLAERGVEVKGALVLMRHGRIFRGLKVRNAERAGAAGAILFGDPADQDPAGEDPGRGFAGGQSSASDAIQRGSVQFLSEAPGDPSTPGWASAPGAPRLPPARMKGIPRIPSLPIAWSEAQKILAAMGGPVAPRDWQGAMPLVYRLGHGPARVHLRTRHDYAVRPIWNVFATLRGREHPGEWVVAGNHRDGWTYGAVDPGSGTISMLEMARAIGALTRTGWRPRRTIVLASWDGEEYGLLGSTEWCEANAPSAGARVAAYLNVDVAVSGASFRASGAHALADLLGGVLRDAPRPSGARYQREIDPPGSGSDYTPFVAHLGVPALDLRFEGHHDGYHSVYDDAGYLERVDPGYHLHRAMVDVWSRLTLRLAEAEVLPLRYSRTARFLSDELGAIAGQAPGHGAAGEDLRGVRAAVRDLGDAARRLERRAERALRGGPWPGGSAAATNAALMRAERGFLGAGLPRRAWFRHEIYAPGIDTGYAPVPIPRLGQAVIDGDAVAWRQGIEPVRAAIARAARALGARPAP